jgi:hypothetical protein
MFPPDMLLVSLMIPTWQAQTLHLTDQPGGVIKTYDRLLQSKTSQADMVTVTATPESPCFFWLFTFQNGSAHYLHSFWRTLFFSVFRPYFIIVL